MSHWWEDIDLHYLNEHYNTGSDTWHNHHDPLYHDPLHNPYGSHYGYDGSHHGYDGSHYGYDGSHYGYDDSHHGFSGAHHASEATSADSLLHELQELREAIEKYEEGEIDPKMLDKVLDILDDACEEIGIPVDKRASAKIHEMLERNEKISNIISDVIDHLGEIEESVISHNDKKAKKAGRNSHNDTKSESATVAAEETVEKELSDWKKLLYKDAETLSTAKVGSAVIGGAFLVAGANYLINRQNRRADSAVEKSEDWETRVQQKKSKDTNQLGN